VSEENMTIIISSHLLSELSLVATHYGIIHDGKLIKELSQEELDQACEKCLSVKVATGQSPKAVEILENKLGVKKIKAVGSDEIRVFDYAGIKNDITKTLINENINIASISEVGENLEDYFTNLIKTA